MRPARSFVAMTWDAVLPLACAGSGAAWASFAARRAGERGGGFAVRALLGGVAAFGLAICAYEVASLLGVVVAWERLARGGLGSAGLAASIGAVEEGAKLVGLLLVLERRASRAAILASAAGVASGFAALEALYVFHGAAAGHGVVLARVALGPVAHALLAVPLALGVAAALGRRAAAWLALAPALAASTVLHGAGDLSLALPWLGAAGYVAALAIPALVLFARLRQPVPAPALADGQVPRG